MREVGGGGGGAQGPSWAMGHDMMHTKKTKQKKMVIEICQAW